MIRELLRQLGFADSRGAYTAKKTKLSPHQHTATVVNGTIGIDYEVKLACRESKFFLDLDELFSMSYEDLVLLWSLNCFKHSENRKR